jgi:hypothetical protein
MKCPKCGYNSFEFLDACKKCGAEFGSFKKTHRISPVILTSAAAAKEAPLELAVTAPPVIPDSSVESTGEEFSWETSGESAAADREESPYSGFDLGFEDSTDAGPQDKAFSGFTFSDEPEVQQPAQAFSTEGELHDGFTFEDTTGEDTETSPLEMKREEPDSGLEGYENLLDLASDGGTDAFAGAMEDTGAARTGDFEADDFSFAPEPAPEDIFQLKEDTVVAAPAEKKTPPKQTDFDKEFEQIFSFGESGDTVEEDPKR